MFVAGRVASTNVDPRPVSAPVCSLQHFPLEALDIDLEKIDRPIGILLAERRQGRDGRRMLDEFVALPSQV